MTYNPETHHRHSIRLKDYDYSQAGAYFVTICTWQRECLFGEIANGEMVLNDVGRVVMGESEKTEKVRNNVILDEFVIMPNHFHGIIFITDDNNVRATRWVARTPSGHPIPQMRAYDPKQGAPPKKGDPPGRPYGPAAGSIAAIMAQFKSITTKRINIIRNNPGCPVWQRNYYERVIRDENELALAREYIVNNPLKWELDRENPLNCR